MPHSIVVRCPNWIGDAVMATPIFDDIKRIFPNSHVVALASEPIAKTLKGLPSIDEFMTFSRNAAVKKSETKRIIRELKKRQFDLGILLTRSFSSAWMFWRGNVKRRLGFKDHFRSILLNIKIDLSQAEEHDVLTYRTLLHPFKTLTNTPELKLVVSEEEITNVRKKFSLENTSFIVINPGAAYGSAKCWPKESFRELVLSLQTTQKKIVFIGDAGSKSLIDDIIQGTSAVSFAGETSLRELLALIATSTCVISNDSGPMHIAAAFGKPLVAIFGSTNPRRTGPWGGGIVIKKDTACSPCYLRTCPKDFACMRSITVGEVEHAAREAIDQYEQAITLASFCKQQTLIKMYDQGKVSYQLAKDLKALDWETLFQQTLLINQKSPPEKKAFQPIDVTLSQAPEHPVSFLKGKNMGCLVMAGGQATRLNGQLPKGLIPISPYEKKPTLQIIAEKLTAYKEAYGTKVFLGIMTSDFSHQKIVDFFQENGFFGLGEASVFFFRQNSLPLLDMNGELIFVDGKIFLGPDGNGHIFQAFSKICKTWEKEGIDYVSIINSDNPLLDPFHPCVMEPLTKGEEMAIAAVKRNFPDESVGLFVSDERKISVVEYSEIDPHLASAENSTHELLFQWANISYLACTLDACKKAATHSLPLHLAKKKKDGISFWKAEYFIFDHLAFMQSCTVVPIEREYFFPLKTLSGENSPKGVAHALREKDRRIFSKIFPKESLPEEKELPQSTYYCKNSLR